MVEHLGNIESGRDQENPEFEFKKTRFFAKLGLRVREVLKLHKQAGLWGEGKDDWRNVSEHCLVESARAEVFTELLKLSEKTKRDLMLAAALHDFYKREDMLALREALKSDGLVWPVLEKQAKKELQVMRQHGVDEDVIYIKEGVGGEKWVQELVLSILVKEGHLSDRDVACLVMHYIDDYTRDANWITPAIVGEDGKKVNELDRRCDKNEANPSYKKLDQEGTGWFKEGETALQAHRRIGHMVEQKVGQLIRERAELNTDPLDLPEFVDSEIRRKINAME